MSETSLDAGTGPSQDQTDAKNVIPSLKSEFFQTGSTIRNRFGRRKVKHGIQILHQDEMSVLEEKRMLTISSKIMGQVIHPNNRWRRTFDMFTVVFVIYLLYKIPFDVAFGWYVNTSFENSISVLLDVWFTLDIILNFKTGYIKNGTAVMHQRKVTK
jgi:hypothetical protein